MTMFPRSRRKQGKMMRWMGRSAVGGTAIDDVFVTTQWLKNNGSAYGLIRPASQQVQIPQASMMWQIWQMLRVMLQMWQIHVADALCVVDVADAAVGINGVARIPMQTPPTTSAGGTSPHPNLSISQWQR
jgi:hypothetical protein